MGHSVRKYFELLRCADAMYRFHYPKTEYSSRCTSGFHSHKCVHDSISSSYIISGESWISWFLVGFVPHEFQLLRFTFCEMSLNSLRLIVFIMHCSWLVHMMVEKLVMMVTGGRTELTKRKQESNKKKPKKPTIKIIIIMTNLTSLGVDFLLWLCVQQMGQNHTVHKWSYIITKVKISRCMFFFLLLVFILLSNARMRV